MRSSMLPLALLTTSLLTTSPSAVVLLTAHPAAAQDRPPARFASAFQQTPDRVWPGPDYWTNPMEDWHVAAGRLECLSGGPNRNVHILTRELAGRNGSLRAEVTVGVLARTRNEGNVGFHIGIEDQIDDYRARVLRGQGMFVGVTTGGAVRIGNQQRQVEGLAGFKSLQLQVDVTQTDDGCTVSLAATDPETGKRRGPFSQTFAGRTLRGNIALVQNLGGGRTPRRGPRFWFRDWVMEGDKLEVHDERRFGPILWAMHTLSHSRGPAGHVLKMTAQLPPLGTNPAVQVDLQLESEGRWSTIQQQELDPLARTATFRVENWPAERDVAYRLSCTLRDVDGKAVEYDYKGTVRRDPVERDVKVAGFTGNQDTGFPNREIVRNVEALDPDVLFFSGDQIYENVGGYGIIRAPVDRAVLNYLRKWYLLGWSFGDLMRDRVTVCLPDDHDVYQGNIWGNGGNAVASIREHDKGGYAQAAEFVNAVHRTQTSHHPDLYDPRPIKQGISVFYGDMVYGRVSFAILADRMFKSGPRQVATWPGRPDHVKDPDFDTSKLDKPGLKLLGDRQLEFLREWAADWRRADVKCVLSQTIFCNLANYHGGNREFIYADLDSNGWPQSGRNRAVAEMRRGLAFHYAGDQHLPSIVHHGIDDFRDAGFSFCVPSIAAGYPRAWRPDKEGRPVRNRPPAGLPNTGDYLDAFKHPMTVYAIGNPAAENRPGRLKTLHDKSSGFGLVTFQKEAGKIKMECYRLLVDVTDPKPDDQFPGWPKTIDVQDNDGREATAWLPTIDVRGSRHPVIQVIREETGESLYTLRIRGDRFQPKVFAPGKYTVKISRPDENLEETVSGLEARQVNDERLRIELGK